MKISRSTGYAVLAAGYIGRSKGEGVVLSQDIAEHYGIPLEYLLKILQQLVRANILRSKRGPRGGFSMARPANKITILEVIEAVDGPMRADLHLADQTKGDKFGGRVDKIYEKAMDEARQVFANTKLSELLSSGKK